MKLILKLTSGHDQAWKTVINININIINPLNQI